MKKLKLIALAGVLLNLMQMNTLWGSAAASSVERHEEQRLGGYWTPGWGGIASTSFRTPCSSERRITKINIFSGALVDALEFYVDGISLGKIGGPGGTKHEVNIPPGDWLIGLNAECGSTVNRLTFETYRGRKFGPFGGPGGGATHFKTSGEEIIGFFGTHGNFERLHLINAIGVIYLRSGLRSIPDITSDLRLRSDEVARMGSEVSSLRAEIASVRKSSGDEVARMSAELSSLRSKITALEAEKTTLLDEVRRFRELVPSPTSTSEELKFHRSIVDRILEK